MRIGYNLRRLRESKGWSQEAFALMLGMSQSTVSNIESNKQDVAWEQIERWALLLEVPPEELIHQDAPVFNSHHQRGGHASNYVIHNGCDTALAAKDEIIATKNEVIALLKERVQALEKEVQRYQKGE